MGLSRPNIQYGPYKNLAHKFAVGERLVREIEVSHWGNVEVTEHYNLVYRGAQLKGEFSRFEYQDRPNPQGITTPFAVKQSHEIKYSHLDIAGRPVVVLEKNNVVPDHNQNIQVYYKFININLLSEPLMLISRFIVLFITCIIYTRADFSISKCSAAYLAKLQWDEVLATLQEVQSIIHKCLAVHDKLEASLRDLSRTGYIQTCKAARKSTDSLLKDLSKELRPLLASLQSLSHQPLRYLQRGRIKDEDSKRKNRRRGFKEEESNTKKNHKRYEKKSSGRDIENRIASQQQKIIALRQEVEDLLDFIDEI
ncbi:hypothetical protein IGI04_027920 [Brassica rapa subsp. trilocularis]|uniref:Dolichyl-diphosphooligosaccharide--protein glycosyltransferase subunit 1 n=1 Tax=Brassica rapa subsp. trilocularis TaxID=1813537 RepID=A0ABQ7L0H9_BRACM|nr:hypothetical protein IGI04_027920 [Brassica rapa subsp. trilocularis]